MNPASDTAKKIIDSEVFYWGQQGLITTQRCAIHASKIRAELININAEQGILDFWIEVLKEIYKQGK